MTSSKGRIGCDHHSRRSRRNGQSHGAVTTSYSTRIHVVLLYLVLLPVLSAFSVLPVHVSIVVHVRMYCMYMYRYSTTCTVQCTTYRYLSPTSEPIVINCLQRWRQSSEAMLESAGCRCRWAAWAAWRGGEWRLAALAVVAGSGSCGCTCCS